MIWKEERAPNPWKLRTTDEEGRKRMWSFPTKKLRDEFLHDLELRKARARSGLPIQQGPITFDHLAALFLDNYTADSKPWKASMLAYSRERFGRTPVHLLRAEQIGQWLHSDLDHLSAKTRSHILGALRQALNAGVEWGYIQSSPARPSAVRPPRGASGATQVFPLESWAEVLAVADAIDPHYNPLVRFACATGLRPQEWSSLEWSEIDRGARVINVNGSKTAASKRAVVLAKPALHALDDLVRRIDTPLVFTSKTGLPIHTNRWGQKYWRAAIELAGLPHRPAYQMRHTFATLALAQECTIEWVSGQLGHANIHITLKHYARFVKRVDDRMRDRLDQMGEEDADEAHG